ncbi:hypothetical protein EV368DRAFT_44889 [Lentinula lateritia]|nr:hypothetical protein EV368DRAFT_44889 [Lentinula lateritia]
MPATVSFRKSIRWIPNQASEPSDTVVLTGGKTGVFLDVRFLKDSNEVDWAFAGYRSTGEELAKFTHLIDSRTEDPSQVADYGSNTVLSDGTVLEKGEMMNPETGKLTAYEEVWQDESSDSDQAIFLRNVTNTSWYARVGHWQLALGRNSAGVFWAFQAHSIDEDWIVVHNLGVTASEKVTFLPEDTSHWAEGKVQEWNGDRWLVLEKE